MRSILMNHQNQLCLMAKRTRIPLHTMDKETLNKELEMLDVSHTELANMFRTEGVIRVDHEKAEVLISQRSN